MQNCMQAHVTAKPHKQKRSTMRTHIHVTSMMGSHAEAAYVQYMHANRECFRNYRSNTRTHTGSTWGYIPVTSPLIKIKLHLPCCALLLTEDNHSGTASPCRCLALRVSACLRRSKCTWRATLDHWQPPPTGPSRSQLSPTSAHTQSDCLTKVSG